MATDKESIKKMFPNLYKELEEGEAKVSIDAVRKNGQDEENEDSEGSATDAEIAEVEGDLEASEPKSKCTPDKLRHFNPSAVDFIRRCDTEVQAEEIIAYLQKKGEITTQCANELRRQLNRDGVRSFGTKKEENHYFREGGIF